MSVGGGEERPIAHTERSGVLYPDRLERYAAGWIDPDPTVAAVVDQYWHVSWDLEPDEALDQPIIDLPAVTVTLETGSERSELLVTGVHGRAWRRTIRGSGDVFAIRLRPAGLAVLSDLTPERLADTVVPLSPELDPRLHRTMGAIATATDPVARARAADRAIEQALVDRVPSAAGLLANAVLDELRARTHLRTGATLAERFATSERTLQRACTETLGHGPKWLSRRVRLQEVALALTRPGAELGAIAAELGYADQSHLTRDFRRATGLTPEGYRRQLRAPRS